MENAGQRIASVPYLVVKNCNQRAGNDELPQNGCGMPFLTANRVYPRRIRYHNYLSNKSLGREPSWPKRDDSRGWTDYCCLRSC